MDIVKWLSDGWILLVAIIGGITLIWNFLHKTLKEIKTEWSKPITKIDEKIDKLDVRLGAMEANADLRQNALLALQRKSLLDSYEHYITKGYITLEEKETLVKQFNSYSELGGNSFVEELIKEIKELPLKSTIVSKNKRSKKIKVVEDSEEE